MAPAAHFWWAVPIVGICGAIVAIVSMMVARATARTRATLDMIERTESSEYYFRIRKTFKQLEGSKGSGDVMQRIIHPITDGDKDFRREIFAYINHYELIAIGSKNGILDECFYADWMRGQLVRDWHLCKEMIFKIRNDPADPAPKCFIEFEGMARRFETNSERGARFARFRGAAKTFFAERVRKIQRPI